MLRTLVLVGIALTFLADNFKTRSTGPSAAEDAQAIETVQLRDISERVTALRERGFTASALRQGLQHALEGYGKSRSRKGANAEAGTTMEVERVLGSIIKASSGGVDLCRHDPSLPSLYANSEHTEAGQYLIAFNMYNQAPLMPRVIRQTLSLLTKLPYEAAYVSMYESNSWDMTGGWLTVFQQLLELFAYPHTIVQGDHESLQHLNATQQHAFSQNKALEPLWHPVAQRVMEGGAVSAAMQPQKIMFIDDVAFCAKDAIRLLSHSVDIACGLDFAHYEDYSGVQLYDGGSARDVDGSVFSPVYPFVTHPDSVRRMHMGLPFPVHSCWSGMAALNAAPFLQHGLQFRAHQPGECAASETSLLCHDFLRLGYANFIMDPGVRLAHDEKASRIVYREDIVAAPVTTWSDVRAVPIEASSTAQQPTFQCCSRPENALHNGTDTLPEPCPWENYLKPNYTDATIGRRPEFQHLL